MTAALWLDNLAAYSLQIALVASAGLLLPRLLRLRAPRLLYRFWQALLAMCLLLPLLQPWRPFETANSTKAASHILAVADLPAARIAAVPVTGLILFVLGAGVAVRFTWLALGLVRLRQYQPGARRLDPLPAGIQESARRLGVTPEIRTCGELQSPVTFGVRRPLILLPLNFSEMEINRQQAVITHELLHVVRHDWVWNLLEECVLAGFWFHPAVWWLVGRIRLGRELVVDQQVVALTRARKPYLCALVEIAAGAGALRVVMAPAFLNECQLAERIRALAKEDGMSKRGAVLALLGVVALTLLAGLAVIHRFPLKSGSGWWAANAPKGGAVQPLRVNPFAATPGVFSVGNGVSAPIPIFKPEPPYTKEARSAKTQGTVVLKIIVGDDGLVRDVGVVKSLDPGLDQSAVDTVKTWKFQPAMKAGKTVPVGVMVEISFKIF
jgi:TonB family protein